MLTVKELRKQAKSYGLAGYTTLRKFGLIRLIAEARAPEFTKRLQRAIMTRRYPALTRGDIENPHKRAQRCRELLQLNEEVNAALRARKYDQQIKKHPEQRLTPLKKATKRILRHGLRSETLPTSIIREGEKLLEEITPKDSKEKGRRTITWKLFRGLEGSIVDKVMLKLETLKGAYYLRYSYTYQIRNVESGKVILFHKNLGGSPTLLTTYTAAREWITGKRLAALT